ncbi:ABC transporter permease [Streptomyces sp. SPB4]|uniref:ABC transporter permease n=1 Tax=Streptomyces sp. SPB4 TaxID=2940553 RepID=UPI002475142F|nr:ABC transporter permease [Streptomyces sp. SPB4]MDH6538122.1 NifC-like ABC-type porter [Streptomyces sp. SPB4]
MLRGRRRSGTRPSIALVLPALLAIAFLLLPLIGILVRTQWSELGTHLTSPGVVEALRLSLIVSFSALGLSLLLGVPLSWLLARVDFPGKTLVRSLVLLPMVLPPTVGGVALLLGFGRRGLLGPWLKDTFGIVFPFHTSGAVLAATFVAMPFLIISLEGTLAGLKPTYEETASSLGASPVRVFFTVTLPMVAPGLAAGAALAWARALGEFGATITFAGNLPGETQTLPLQVYLLLQDAPEAATSVSLLLLAIAVVGENGAGKTTLLRALLGLTPRAHAELRLGDLDVTALPPHKRQVAWVPQDGALFPHLNALANTAYGLRAHGMPKAEARTEARHWLDRLGVGHLAHRRPAELSGGQAQRVALARALAARPRLLLLDEPLAALDQTTRAHVRHTLRRHLAGFGGVCLIVTHDPVEAVSLADRVLVLADGRTLQDAPPGEVTRHPRSPWVARMLGRNAWPCTATRAGLTLATGGILVAADPLPEGAKGLAIIAPESVSLHRDKPTGSPRNVWPGTVREITVLGSRLRILITSDRAPDLIAEITPEAAVDLALADGTDIWASLKATEITLVEL